MNNLSKVGKELYITENKQTLYLFNPVFCLLKLAMGLKNLHGRKQQTQVQKTLYLSSFNPTNLAFVEVCLSNPVSNSIVHENDANLTKCRFQAFSRKIKKNKVRHWYNRRSNS